MHIKITQIGELFYAKDDYCVSLYIFRTCIIIKECLNLIIFRT